MRGRFWIAGNEQTATSGVLRWSRSDGANLWLIGPPTEWPGAWRSRDEADEGLLVHGITGANGVKVTIPSALVTRSSFGTGITQLNIRSLRLILFSHLTGSETWKRMVIRTANLHEWFPLTGFDSPDATFDRRFQVQRYAVKWKAPRATRVPLRDAEVHFSPRMETDPTPWKPERSITTSMDMAIHATQAATIEALHKRYARPLLNFLVLATGFPDEITYEAVWRGQRTRAVVLRQRTHANFTPREWRPERPLLFYARHLPDVREAIKKWFRLHERVSPALEVFADSMIRDEYSPAWLIDVASSIETYHRELYDKIWKTTWRRKHPRKRLGQRPYLVDRLAHLQHISGLPESATGLTLQNRRLFVASRNHFAHLSAPSYGYSREDVYDNAIYTIRRGIALLQASVMHRLGFNTSQTGARFAEHYRSWRIPL